MNTEYIVLTRAYFDNIPTNPVSRETFASEVTKYIKNGWKPQGGISISVIYSTQWITTYAQALTKEFPE